MEIFKRLLRRENMTTVNNEEIIDKEIRNDSIEDEENDSIKPEKNKVDNKNEKLCLQNIEKANYDNYEFPPLNLLNSNNEESKKDNKDIKERALNLQNIFDNYGVSVNVENVVIGPTIITYQIKLSTGVRISKIKGLKDDIALRLETKVINIEQVPNTSLLGIQVQRKDKEIVAINDIFNDEQFQKEMSKMTIALGKDISGINQIINLEDTAHILIGGTTGSGKSICIHSIINSILFKAKPNEVKFLMIDTKEVELSMYNGIPHLLIPVVTNVQKAIGALEWLNQEVDLRYNMLAKENVKNMEQYNNKNEDKIPNILLIIDEFADLIEFGGYSIEDLLYRLTQRAKKVGIYIVIATERPSRDILNGTIKADITTRIVFNMASKGDSKTIIDSISASELMGEGDMLYYTMEMSKPTRMQGSYISEEQVKRIVDFLKQRYTFQYDENIMTRIKKSNEGTYESGNSEYYDDNDGFDPLLNEAIEVCVEIQQASTSIIQRTLKTGYARARKNN